MHRTRLHTALRRAPARGRAVIALLLLLAVALVSGCALQPVEVVRPDMFRNYAIYLRDEMVRRNILDAEGNYMEAAIRDNRDYSPASYGEELYRRLSTRFRSAEARNGLAGETFADGATADANVRIGKVGFALGQGMDVISVSLTAITDWNGDGVNDWLVTCTVTPLFGNGPREYYLAVENVGPEGVLKPTLLAIRDCANNECTVLVGKARTKALGFDPDRSTDKAPANFVESQPGQQIVLPPNTPAPAGAPGAAGPRVQEQSLSK